MDVRVKLHSTLRDYLPPEAKGWATCALPKGATVVDLKQHLKINRPCSVAVNGIDVDDDRHVLQAGDDVHMFWAVGGG